MSKLSKAHETAMKNFSQLLTGSVSTENFHRAFPSAGERYPAALAANADPETRGVLSFAMESEFGALTRAAPEAIPLLVTDVIRNFTTLARAEFDALMAEMGLPEKFVELERREDALRTAAGDAASDRPAPLTLLPEDEMRSIAVESKLLYEQQLSKELEKVRAAWALSQKAGALPLTPCPPPLHPLPAQLRKENAALDAEVSALSARSKAVRVKTDARMTSLEAAATAAQKLLSADAPSAAADKR
jgi:hypothetical protein